MKAAKRRDVPEVTDLGDLAKDRSAKFAYELATKPPIKDVASVKAASDIFDANPTRTAPRGLDESAFKKQRE